MVSSLKYTQYDNIDIFDQIRSETVIEDRMRLENGFNYSNDAPGFNP